MVSGSLALLYFLLGFHGGRQGSGPDRGQSPVESGDFLSVCTYVCPFVYPSPLWAIHPGLRPSQPDLRPSQPGLRPSQPGLRPSQPGLRPSQPGLRLRKTARPQASGLAGWASGQMYVRTDGCRENLPVLQDFVPYRGRCPASPHENQGESRAGQGNR